MTDGNWQRADGWVGAPFEDGLVMVEIERGTYVGLNDTAAAIWDALERPVTEAQIVERLKSAFDVPDQTCADAVRSTLVRFQEVGLAHAA